METNSSQEVAAEECIQYESMQHMSWTYSTHVHGYVSVIVCILGGLSNVANIVVLTRRHMVSSTNILLCAIAVANLFTMLVCIPVYIHFYLANTVQNPPQSASIGWMFIFLAQINFAMFSHTVAVWLTIILALFRYVFIAFPLRGGITVARANMSIAIVCACSALVCIPNVLCNSFHVRSSFQLATNSSVLVYEIGEPENIEHSLRLTNFWVIALLIRFFPCVLLTVFTVLLSFEMRKAALRRQKLKHQGSNRDHSQRRKESKTTLMLFAVVVSFLVIDLPQGVLTVLNALVPCFYPSIYMPLGDFIDLLTLFQAVVNFVLFTTMSQQFRSTFSSIFLFWLDSLLSQLSLQPGAQSSRVPAAVGGCSVRTPPSSRIRLSLEAENNQQNNQQNNNTSSDNTSSISKCNYTRTPRHTDEDHV